MALQAGTRTLMTSLLFSVLLAGCGGGDTAPETEAAATTPSATSSSSIPLASGDQRNLPTLAIVSPDFVEVGQTVDFGIETSGQSYSYDWTLVRAPQESRAVLATDNNANTISASKSITALPQGQGPVISYVDINSRASSSSSDTNVPLTFGQVLVPGHVQPGYTLSARLENGDTVPLQVDTKSWYPDGSMKHAVLSTIIPQLQGGDQLRLELMACEEYEPAAAVEISDLPAQYKPTVTIEIGGQNYTASLQQAMALGESGYWLEGAVVTEAHFQAPFVNADNSQHPLLEARFQLRQYQSGAVRIDVVVENTTTFVPGISNLSYTAAITAEGVTLMPAEQVPHNHHSRWRKTFWFGTNHDVLLGHDLDYLTATGSIPNYDRSVVITSRELDNIAAVMQSSGDKTGIRRDAIMGAGMAVERMPNGGGRSDIGLIPGWTATYLLTKDNRAADATFATALAAAHWPIHYRDRDTDLPVSLESYPDLTIHSNVFDRPSNPLPSCSNCSTNLTPDTAHQPSMAFVPYLVSGDFYFLEELHFWTNWNAFHTAPVHRGYSSALYKFQQARGQAWSLRTLLQTVFITPDNHPSKRYFQTQLDNNIDFYLSEYVNNPTANQLGWIQAADRPDRLPWHDDFFSTTINYARHLGFDQVLPILEWKLQYARKRMTDSVYCWQLATIYRHWVAPNDSASAWFDNMADTWIETLRNQFGNWQEISQLECGTAAMSAAIGLNSAGDFAGSPSHPNGHPAAIRPVIAAALELDQDWAALAWQRLVNAPTQPRFHDNPAWAIVPRQ